MVNQILGCALLMSCTIISCCTFDTFRPLIEIRKSPARSPTNSAGEFFEIELRIHGFCPEIVMPNEPAGDLSSSTFRVPRQFGHRFFRLRCIVEANLAKISWKKPYKDC